MNRILSKITLILMWFALGWMAFSAVVWGKSSQADMNLFFSLALLQLSFLVTTLQDQLKALRNG